MTAEYAPLARTGGLGEAVSGLSGVQAASGTPTTIVMPFYRTVQESAAPVEVVGPALSIELGGRIEQVRLLRLASRGSGPRVFFIDHPDSFDRPELYGTTQGDYRDNARRFALFARAALAALPVIAPSARILHAHDWHAALAPVFLRTALAGQAYFDRLATVLSVHNAGFQGNYSEDAIGEVGLPGEVCHRALASYGQVSFLRGGITYSEAVITVSPSHARELCTAEGGFGLHDTFRALGSRLDGILNGIDLTRWNPETDSAIAAPYSRHDPAGKRHCKAALQRAYRLPESPGTPLFGVSSRLAFQKGFDLILGGGLMAWPDAQFVFLGRGEPRFEAALTSLARSAPDRIGVQLDFTDQREHELMAGTDVLLMPSLYEPCGLAQMKALRYGSVPLARRTGGLADTIEDGVTGFLFDEYSPAGLERAARRVMEAYRSGEWPRVMQSGMARSCGWRAAADQYRDVYRRVLRHHNPMPA